MFIELMPLLRTRRLLLTVSLVEGDTIRATVVPQKASETEDNAVTTPLAITGTAEELDRDLPQQLVEFTGAHLQLQTTLDSAKAEMEAAAKAAEPPTAGVPEGHVGCSPRGHPHWRLLVDRRVQLGGCCERIAGAERGLRMRSYLNNGNPKGLLPSSYGEQIVVGDDLMPCR